MNNRYVELLNLEYQDYKKIFWMLRHKKLYGHSYGYPYDVYVCQLDKPNFSFFGRFGASSSKRDNGVFSEITLLGNYIPIYHWFFKQEISTKIHNEINGTIDSFSIIPINEIDK